MKYQKLKKFTLLELLVVIAVIGILMTILFPSLQEARVRAQATVCKSNLKQMHIGEMLYAKDNNRKIWAGHWGAEFMTRTFYQPDGINRVNFHDGNTGFLEPYTGDGNSAVYNCPATDYDKSSVFYNADKGRSYEGFMDINASKPEFIKDFYVRTGPGLNDLAFEDASRKPLFWDFTNTIGGTDWAKSIGSSSIHGNKGRINLAVTDGTVVPVKLPTVYWKPWIQPEWIIALERALGESAN